MPAFTTVTETDATPIPLRRQNTHPLVFTVPAVAVDGGKKFPARRRRRRRRRNSRASTGIEYICRSRPVLFRCCDACRDNGAGPGRTWLQVRPTVKPRSRLDAASRSALAERVYSSRVSTAALLRLCDVISPVAVLYSTVKLPITLL